VRVMRDRGRSKSVKRTSERLSLSFEYTFEEKGKPGKLSGSCEVPMDSFDTKNFGPAIIELAQMLDERQKKKRRG